MVTLIIEIRRIGIHEIARTHNIHVLQITNLINVHKATVDHRNEDALAVEPRLMQFLSVEHAYLMLALSIAGFRLVSGDKRVGPHRGGRRELHGVDSSKDLHHRCYERQRTEALGSRCTGVLHQHRIVPLTATDDRKALLSHLFQISAREGQVR